MHWYMEPRTTIGPFLAWLESNEGRKDKRKAVALFQGIVYIGGRELPSGTGSYNVLSGGNPLVKNSANEKSALTMEIAIQASSGETPAQSEGRLDLTFAMGRFITSHASRQGATVNPQQFVEHDRTAANFLRAAYQAQDNGFNLTAVQNELARYAQWIKPRIQRWFDVWNMMRGETASPAAIKALQELRKHQKMKIAGGSFGRGKHEEGQFILFTRAIDGYPLLLISSKLTTAIKSKYTSIAHGHKSVVNRVLSGNFTHNLKADQFVFNFTEAENAGALNWFRNLRNEKRQDIVDDAFVAMGLVKEGQHLGARLQINVAG